MRIPLHHYASTTSAPYRQTSHPISAMRRDSAGKDHLILADQGCRNTVFNAQAQTGTYFLRGWALAGVGWLRVELVDEGPEHVAPLLEGYRAVLKVQSSPGELMQYLQTVPDANGRAHGCVPVATCGAFGLQRLCLWLCGMRWTAYGVLGTTLVTNDCRPCWSGS